MGQKQKYVFLVQRLKLYCYIDIDIRIILYNVTFLNNLSLPSISIFFIIAS